MIESPASLVGPGGRLWRIIAPERNPHPTGAAFFTFQYRYGLENQESSPEVSFLDHHLVRYAGQGDYYLASLSLDPRLDTEHSGRTTLKMVIWAPPPPQMPNWDKRWTRVMELRELAEQGKNPCGVLIIGEGPRTYSDGFADFELTGVDPDNQKMVWKETVDQPFKSQRGDTAWKSNFVRENLEHFITLVGQDNADFWTRHDFAVMSNIGGRFKTSATIYGDRTFPLYNYDMASQMHRGLWRTPSL